MNPLRLVFAEARKGMWSLLALALLLGLSIGSGVCITSVEKAVRAGAARAGDDFDLIIGAQGSATDLVLSGVYLRENTLKLIPGELLSGIRRSKGTAWAAPLAFGDRWGRYPVVGTSADLVTLGGKRGVAEGRLFTVRVKPWSVRPFRAISGSISRRSTDTAGAGTSPIRSLLWAAFRLLEARGTRLFSCPWRRSGFCTVSCLMKIWRNRRVPF